ncbi:MAG: hypothetical protein AB1757_24355 [Acidobacteriota bacterium]
MDEENLFDVKEQQNVTTGSLDAKSEHWTRSPNLHPKEPVRLILRFYLLLLVGILLWKI